MASLPAVLRQHLGGSSLKCSLDIGKAPPSELKVSSKPWNPAARKIKQQNLCDRPHVLCCSSKGIDHHEEAVQPSALERRALLASAALGVGVILFPNKNAEASGENSKFTDMPALRGKDYGKSRMTYPDYIETPSGLQYKDLRGGTGDAPLPGQTVVVDWDGFTIGYYGRIFEARNKAKGGSFEGNDKEYFRFVLGRGQVIPAFDEAVASMRVGGVRRIIVPPELGYPDNDMNRGAPKPLTFSGQRALDFVLRNQGLIDKTLLFDIELLKIV